MSVNQITIYASAHSKQKLRPTRIREKNMCDKVKVTFTWIMGLPLDEPQEKSVVTKEVELLYDEYIALLTGGIEAQKAYILGNYESLSPDTYVNKVRMTTNGFIDKN